MAQTTNYEIANSSGLVFRGRVNEVFAAVQSNNSGATAPTGTVAYQLWYDTTTNILKMRNASNSAWIDLFTLDQTNSVWSVNANSTSNALRITQTGTGNALLVEDSANPDSTPFVITAAGDVGIGTTNPQQLLHLSGTVPDIQYTDTTGNEWRVGNNNGVFRFYDVTAAAERMRIDSSGNVGIGTTSPGKILSIRQPADNNGIRINHATRATSTYWDIELAGVNNEFLSLLQFNGTSPVTAYAAGRDTHIFNTAGTERMRIDSSGNVGIGTSPAEQLHITGNFRVGSAVMATPTGSAPLYACRAWVNFNGTGTVAIRGSGNVTSITDDGLGIYRVNFTTALQDANYAVTIATNNDSDSLVRNTIVSIRPAIYSTTQVGVLMFENGGVNIDKSIVCVSVFR